MSALDVLTGRRRTDQRRWADTASLMGLCELTVGWLNGEIRWCPGYTGPVDVDDVPGLRECLVSANERGFLTVDSQQGYEGPGAGGTWVQHAGVTGFAGERLATRLVRAARHDGYEAYVRDSGMDPITVTDWNGLSHTAYGWVDAKTIAKYLFPGVGRTALREVTAAAQVTIVDPDPGFNDLWPWLTGALRAFPARIGGRS